MQLVAQSNQLDKDIAHFNSSTAKQLLAYQQEKNANAILEQLAFFKKADKDDRAYQFGQEGVHPELIQSEYMTRRKIEYIHQNSVKRGYVDESVDWQYSSGRNYAGLAGVFE